MPAKAEHLKMVTLTPETALLIARKPLTSFEPVPAMKAFGLRLEIWDSKGTGPIETLAAA